MNGLIQLSSLLATLLLSSCESRPYQGEAAQLLDSNTTWVRPTADSLPVWGHLRGLQLGIHPTKGPRGLLRLYAPYLGHESEKMINFFALEPIVQGESQRGFSELEISSIDGKRGKVFTSHDQPPSGSFNPNAPLNQGQIDTTAQGEERLTIFIRSEPFASGAEVYVRARFYASRPYEVELTAYALPDSAPLDYFIITATMGNFARLRELYLADTTLQAGTIWPHYQKAQFTDHHSVSPEQFVQGADDSFYLIAAPDEADPASATYAPGTKDHWRYYGNSAVQYWRLRDTMGAEGLVNGRYTYWASTAPIPGGIAFENMEIKRPHRNGATYVFGVYPSLPAHFLSKISR